MTKGAVILIADDDAGHARLIEKNLQRAGLHNPVPSLWIAASSSMPSRSKTEQSMVTSAPATADAIFRHNLVAGELATFVAKMAKDGERKFQEIPCCAYEEGAMNSDECNG